jgi:hypothetical protein
MKMDGVTLLAVIVIGAFAIERITHGMLFLLDLLDFTWWRRLSEDPALQADPIARAAAERKRTFTYFVLAFALGLVLTGFGKLRVLNAVGIETTWYFDVVLTALILVGGADRVAELLKVPGARSGEKAVERPVQVSGTLVLEDASAKKVVTPGGQ